MLKKLLILLLLPFILCSCAKQVDSEKITFSSWGSVTEVKILENLINKFEKENPDIKIEFIHIPQNYFQKIHLLFVSSQEPDVLFINNLYLPIYAKYLENLTGTTDISKFHHKSIEALSINNKLLAIPRDISNLVFYYNKELTNSPISQNWSFNEFQKLIKESSKNSKFATSFEPDIYWTTPYILTLGDFDKGITYYKSLENKFAPSASDVGSLTLAQMFINGDIAFYLSGRWMYPKLKEQVTFEWGILPFPGITQADASGWAISKNSKHKLAAKKFIEFLSSKASIDYFTQTGLIVPARLDSIVELENGNAFIEAIEHSVVLPYDKNYRHKADKLNKELFN